MAIRYTNSVEGLRPDQLAGFFVGWPQHPDPAGHLRVLRGSYRVWLAMDGERCVGWINAISDGVFYACIPLVEVLPAYQGRGIGAELVRRMVGELAGMYAIDLQCDETLKQFYERLGFDSKLGMVVRNYENAAVSGS